MTAWDVIQMQRENYRRTCRREEWMQVLMRVMKLLFIVLVVALCVFHHTTLSRMVDRTLSATSQIHAASVR